MKVVRSSHYYDSEIGETVIVAIFKASSEEEDIEGASRPNRDGTYTIFINIRLSKEAFDRTFEHERGHIINGDFDYDKRGMSVQVIETIAHQEDKPEEKVYSEASERVIRYMRNRVARLRRQARKKEQEAERLADLLYEIGFERTLIESEDEFGVPVTKYVIKRGKQRWHIDS